MHKLPFLIVVACFGFVGFSLWFLSLTEGGAAGDPSPRSVPAPEAPAGEAPVEALTAMVRDPDPGTRREGVQILAARDALDEETCRHLLADEEVEVRRSVVEALSQRDVPGRIALLSSAIRDVGGDVAVRAIAAAALVRIESDETIPYMIDYLEDEDPYVRLYAIQILESLTGDSLGYQPYSPIRARVAKAEEWRRWWAARKPK